MKGFCFQLGIQYTVALSNFLNFEMEQLSFLTKYRNLVKGSCLHLGLLLTFTNVTTTGFKHSKRDNFKDGGTAIFYQMKSLCDWLCFPLGNTSNTSICLFEGDCLQRMHAQVQLDVHACGVCNHTHVCVMGYAFKYAVVLTGKSTL